MVSGACSLFSPASWYQLRPLRHKTRAVVRTHEGCRHESLGHKVAGRHSNVLVTTQPQAAQRGALGSAG
jgi:hypothetical protein